MTVRLLCLVIATICAIIALIDTAPLDGHLLNATFWLIATLVFWLLSQVLPEPSPPPAK